MKNLTSQQRSLVVSFKWSICFLTALLINLSATAQSTSYKDNTNGINGQNCTAFGWFSLYQNTTGSYNTATGNNSLVDNTTGNYNVATGFLSLGSNTTGSNNVANGSQSLLFNTTGNYNTAVGALALYYNGQGADVALDEGNRNTAVGQGSMYKNTKGFYNTALGVSSLFENITGYYNTAIGYNALQSNLTGNYNTALGLSAGFSSLGSGCVFIGYGAGYNETRSGQLYIGNSATNAILYGSFSTGQVLFGKADPTGYLFKGTRTVNVIGGIIADSIRVALSANWADHVFTDTYTLKPLSELENFIKTNKHLPNIPSAKEVKEAGIELGEMNAKLLEKVEELTLYIIAQQKQIDELKQLVKNK